jgi:hypothetical protein
MCQRAMLILRRIILERSKRKINTQKAEFMQPGTAIVLFIIIVLAAWLSSRRLYEAFAAAPQRLVYTSHGLNHNAWLSGDVVKSLDLDSWDILLKAINTNGGWPSNMQTGLAATFLVCDPLDQERIAGLGDIVKKSQPGYFVSLAAPAKAFAFKCTYNLAGKTIGYIDRSDLYFIRAIMRGYRIPESSVNLRPITMQEWERIGDLCVQEIDQVITFIIPSSPFHLVLRGQALSLQGFAGINMDRIRMFYPYITATTNLDLNDTFVTAKSPGASLLVMDRERNSPVMKMQMLLVRMAGGGTTEGFVMFRSPVEMPRDALDPAYTCYGDRSIEQKLLCDSAYDAVGQPKMSRTVWDRPCFTDGDCPYYDAGKGRGGCLPGGLCEMPVGARRQSFRAADASYAPFCYGCDPYDTACCSSKKREYVFSGENRRVSEL